MKQEGLVWVFIVIAVVLGFAWYQDNQAKASTLNEQHQQIVTYSKAVKDNVVKVADDESKISALQYQLHNIEYSIPNAIIPDEPESHPTYATALCKDGTYSYAVNHQGSCSHHGGVMAWL